MLATSPVLPIDVGGLCSSPAGRCATVLSGLRGLDLTYTHHGTELDPLTPTQQRILELLAIQPPWPQPET